MFLFYFVVVFVFWGLGWKCPGIYSLGHVRSVIDMEEVSLFGARVEQLDDFVSLHLVLFGGLADLVAGQRHRRDGVNVLRRTGTIGGIRQHSISEAPAFHIVSHSNYIVCDFCRTVCLYIKPYIVIRHHLQIKVMAFCDMLQKSQKQLTNISLKQFVTLCGEF